MEEMNKAPEEHNIKDVKEQDAPALESTNVSESGTKKFTPKVPIPKLPFIIGSAVAGVAAIAVAVAVIVGGGSHEHSFGEWKTVDAPTCISAGIEERVCECGDKEMHRVDALGHTEVVDEAVAATCKSTGLTEGKHCSTCGTIIVAQTPVDKIPHTYDNENDADCNICSETRVVDCTHSQTEIIGGYAATCTATGLTDGAKCKKCGEIIVAQETIPMVAHTYDNEYDDECNLCGHKRDTECGHFETETIIGYAATCTATGLTDGAKCKKCGIILIEQTILPVNSHEYKESVTIQPTCTTVGVKTFSCTCGNSYTEEIVSKGHTYDNGICVECNEKQTLSAGLYDANGNMLASWEELTNVYYMDVTKSYTSEYDAISNMNSPFYVLNEYEELRSGVMLVIGNVSSIGNRAFQSCSRLTSISLPSTITSIGVEAFKRCYGLIRIDLPDALMEIGDGAFYSCASLTNVTIPSNITRINDETFYDCDKLKNINLPESITYIGADAFYDCTNLSNLIIPESVTRIGNSAFYHCSNLASISIPSSVMYINTEAFYNCTGLTNVTFAIDSKLENIGSYAFAGCKKMTNFSIPEGVTTIGAFAFYDCSKLTSIYFPSSMKEIGVGTLKGCNDLINITVASGSVFHSEENCLIETDSKTIIAGCKSSIIPSDGSVKYIGDYAFSGCFPLTEIVLPDSIMGIGADAFAGCTGLTEILIPFQVKTVGASAFSGCTGLTEVEFRSSLEEIGSSAFKGCIGLKEIHIPGGTKRINSRAFYGCTGLIDVYIPRSITTAGPFMITDVFTNCSSLTNITFRGTTSQWNDIWIDLGTGFPATYVQCSNGRVTIQ